MELMHEIFSFQSMNITIVFGLCLLFGVLGGICANRMKWMPTITAFMLLGIVIGPSGLQLISPELLKSSIVFIDIALGLILYDLGTMLHPREMIKSRKLLLLSICDAVMTFIPVFLGCLFLGFGTVASAMISAIAISSSPAVLVHVLAEMRASGPVSERAKSMVAINNVIAFLLFSLMLPFGLVQEAEGGDFVMAIVLPLYRLVGAVVVGIGMAWVATKIAEMLSTRDLHYRFAIVIGAVMLTLGICQMLNMSALFSPLVLGLATRWMEHRHKKLSVVELGEGGDLFFIVLFVMAGAKINFGELASMGLIPVALVVLRSLGKMGGVFIAGKMNGTDIAESRATGMMILPMAGMAIGLVTSTTALSPEIGRQLATTVFTMVAIFETIGPFLVAHALRLSGEVDKSPPLEPISASHE